MDEFATSRRARGTRSAGLRVWSHLNTSITPRLDARDAAVVAFRRFCAEFPASSKLGACRQAPGVRAPGVRALGIGDPVSGGRRCCGSTGTRWIPRCGLICGTCCPGSGTSAWTCPGHGASGAGAGRADPAGAGRRAGPAGEAKPMPGAWWRCRSARSWRCSSRSTSPVRWSGWWSARPRSAGGTAEPGIAERYRALALLSRIAGPGERMTDLWMSAPPDIFRGTERHPRAPGADPVGHRQAQLGGAGQRPVPRA